MATASRTFTTLASALGAAALTAAVGLAQQPRLTNGKVTTQPAPALQQAFKAAVSNYAEVGWVGYAVPVVDGERVMCCFNSGNGFVTGSGGNQACCGMCLLDPSTDGTTMSTRPQAGQAGAVKLEGADTMVVLFRIVNGQVERVRVFSEDCQLDAGGREITWLTGVKPPESVALLESLVTVTPSAGRRDRIVDGSISAIALHEDASATAALERLLAHAQPQQVRAKVPFWLGNTRGRRGLEILQRVVKDDPSIEVKKKAVFGISQSREPQAVDVLIENAKTNADTSVRSESIFWLAQKAGAKAAAAITERIEQDPDTEVKKKAVFALSQLPKDEGVPLLLQVARTHSNPAVRKQAIFWLGQSKDPRALAFFAEVLK
jgi:HEAT repeat protein